MFPGVVQLTQEGLVVSLFFTWARTVFGAYQKTCFLAGLSLRPSCCLVRPQPRHGLAPSDSFHDSSAFDGSTGEAFLLNGLHVFRRGATYTGRSRCQGVSTGAFLTWARTFFGGLPKNMFFGGFQPAPVMLLCTTKVTTRPRAFRFVS